MVKEVGTTVVPLAEKNSNRLDVQCPADVGTMYQDITRVRQCLLNLLSNACKFTQGGTVSLKVERRRQAEHERGRHQRERR